MFRDKKNKKKEQVHEGQNIQRKKREINKMMEMQLMKMLGVDQTSSDDDETTQHDPKKMLHTLVKDNKESVKSTGKVTDQEKESGMFSNV